MIIESLKHYLGLYVAIPCVLFVGIYLTLRLKGLQLTLLPLAFQKVFKQNSGTQKSLSSFSALAAVLGGNLGTGNIAGIAVALSTGGPGALFWMWVMAFFGSIIKFAGCFLGVKYRKKLASGALVGGPMYYLSKGLKKHKLAKIFSLLTILSALSVGNLVQINSIALPLTTAGISPIITGIVMAVLVAMVLLGGAHSFSKVAAKIVPVMASIYVFACLYILGTNLDAVILALQLVLKMAFSSQSLVGGVLGFTVLDAIRVGFDRGLFATDAGVGLAPIIHSQVQSDEPLEEAALTQGIISILAPMIVMVICMITGLVLLVTGAMQTNLESTNLCILAFQLGFHSHLAGHIVTFTLALFAFTTILTWAYCAECAVAFLAPKSAVIGFRALFVCLIPVGAFCSVQFVWSVADIALNAMLLVNMLGVVGLSREVVQDVMQLYAKKIVFGLKSAVN